MTEHRELPRDAPPIGRSDAAPLPGVPGLPCSASASLASLASLAGSPGSGSPPPASPGRPLSRRARAALPLSAVGAGMLVRWLHVHPADVVFVKGVVDASDGLAAVFAEQGGELLLAAPFEREGELAELLADLEAELGGRARPPGQEP